MKQLFVLFVLATLISCSKDSGTNQPKQATIVIDIKKNQKLSTGEVVEKDVDVSVVHIWKATDANFSVQSLNDAIGGYAYDNVKKQSVKADITRVYSSHLNETVEPGRYFVFVMLGSDIGAGKLAYSYTLVDVSNGETKNVKKVFTTHAVTASFEEWNQAE